MLEIDSAEEKTLKGPAVILKELDKHPTLSMVPHKINKTPF